MTSKSIAIDGDGAIGIAQGAPGGVSFIIFLVYVEYNEAK